MHTLEGKAIAFIPNQIYEQTLKITKLDEDSFSSNLKIYWNFLKHTTDHVFDLSGNNNLIFIFFLYLFILKKYFFIPFHHQILEFY